MRKERQSRKVSETGEEKLLVRRLCVLKVWRVTGQMMAGANKTSRIETTTRADESVRGNWRAVYHSVNRERELQGFSRNSNGISLVADRVI